MKVRTKKLQNGIWCCFATINGIDYSFKSDNFYKAQQLIRDKILSINYDAAIEWMQPTRIPKQEKIKRPKIGYGYTKIDNL